MLAAGDWTPVHIGFDLEKTPLEIKTDSAAGSDENMKVFFYTSARLPPAQFFIYFDAIPRFGFSSCISATEFPDSLPAADEKVWRINLDRTTSGVEFEVHCNDEKVVDILMTDDTCRSVKWREYWDRDVVQIKFDKADKASDYYRPLQGDVVRE